MQIFPHLLLCLFCLGYLIFFFRFMYLPLSCKLLFQRFMSERQFSSQQETYLFSHKSRSPEYSLLQQHRRISQELSPSIANSEKKIIFFRRELFFTSKSSFWVTVMRLPALGWVLTKNFQEIVELLCWKPFQKLKENIQLLDWCLGNAPYSPHKTGLTWNVSSNSHKYSNHSLFVADLYLLSLTHTCKSPKELYLESGCSCTFLP